MTKVSNSASVKPHAIHPGRPVKGYINNILPHSFVDGPGNRLVVFLQGCNFNCLYCHNPYTIQMCNSCGTCVPACPSNALSIFNMKILWLPDQCVDCDTCITVCPHLSSPKVKQYSPEQLWDRVRSDSRYVSGISVSGGEPMLQAEFVGQFFELVKNHSNLSTLIETNGFVGPSAYYPLLKNLDLALVDLKTIDPVLHVKITGKPLEPVLESIVFMHEQRKLHAVQQVIVPGFTDTIEHTRLSARFIKNIDPTITLRLLRFRPHGTAGNAMSWDSPQDDLMDELVRSAKEEGLLNVNRSL